MRRHHSIILLALLAFGCEYAESGQSAVSRDAGRHSGDRIQAIVLDARERPSDAALTEIRDLGATHVSLVSFGFQNSANDPHVRFSPDVRWYSESAGGVRELATRLAELDMKVILKPQIWIGRGAWSADIDFDSEDDWATWESEYRDYILHTARLGQEIGADMLVIGTELSNPVRERPDFWRALIADVRQMYRGKLTYGANWHDDYLGVPFWDELDYVGVQAYFPLSSSDRPSLDDLRSGWDSHLADLLRVSEKEDLPVLFTEIGYRSVSYAAETPWRWPSRDEVASPEVDLQADLYRVFFERVWPQPWFAGAIIWKFYPAGEVRARNRDLDFTPQNKPGEDVIRRHFAPSEGS